METERSIKRKRLLKSLVRSESKEKRERIAKTLLEMEDSEDRVGVVDNALWDREMLVKLAQRIEKKLARLLPDLDEEVRFSVRRRDARDFFKPIRIAYRKCGFSVVLEETEKEEFVRNTWSLYSRRKKGTPFVLEKTTAELRGKRKFWTLVFRKL